MAFRPLATAGIAFAAAGVMAFTPTIVPQLTEREEQVAKATSANVKLVADLEDLINVYFGTNPYNGIPFDASNPALFGTSGVVYQLLKEQAGGYAPNQQFLDSFFGSGFARVVYDYLASGTTDPATLTYLGTYFNTLGVANPSLFGASGVVYLRLLASDLTPEQKGVVNDLFQGGLTQVSRTQLLARFTSPEQQTFINDLYDGGTTQLAYRQLGGDFDNPDTSSTPYLSSFFNINNPYGDPDEEGVNTGVSSNPGLYGASGVVFRRIQEAAATGNITPDQYGVLQDFFQGGATQVALTQLLARTADPNQRNIINEFFSNGVAGVVRYLLVGPAPTDPEEETLLRVAAQTSVPPVEESAPAPAPEPEPELDAAALTAPAPEARSARQAPAVTQEAPAVDETAAVTPVAVVESAPAVQPAPVADPAPAAAPAPEPVAKPTSKIREKSAAEEAEAEKLKSGNKAEVEPIIITGDGPKSGEGSWGVFGDIANSIGQALNGGGAAPAGGATGDTGGEGAGAEG